MCSFLPQFLCQVLKDRLQTCILQRNTGLGCWSFKPSLILASSFLGIVQLAVVASSYRVPRWKNNADMSRPWVCGPLTIWMPSVRVLGWWHWTHCTLQVWRLMMKCSSTSSEFSWSMSFCRSQGFSGWSTRIETLSLLQVKVKGCAPQVPPPSSGVSKKHRLGWLQCRPTHSNTALLKASSQVANLRTKTWASLMPRQRSFPVCLNFNQMCHNGQGDSAHIWSWGLFKMAMPAAYDSRILANVSGY